MLQWFRSQTSAPVPAGPPLAVRRFTTSDPTISQDPLKVDGDGWSAEVSDGQTIPLFEITPPPLDHCLITWRLKMKTEALADKAYLEMWCRFDGRGEFFSKGFDHAITGTNDWASYEVTFFLQKGQSPDLRKLNLAIEGAGRVWIKDVELTQTPLS